MSSYKLTPIARKGLRDTYQHVKRAFGIDVAENVVHKLVEAFRSLAAVPGMGHPRVDLTLDTGVRFWSVGPTLIAYRQDCQGIEILLVERSNRDWRTLINDLDLD